MFPAICNAIDGERGVVARHGRLASATLKEPTGEEATHVDCGQGTEVVPGFFCCGFELKLQFHWMPRQNDLLRGISDDVSPQELSTTVGKTYGDLDLTDSLNPVFALDRRSSISHHVQTGDILYVKVEPRYAERMLAAFRIQWAVIKILAMAGGAESLDDVGDHPDYLDENLNWLGDSGLTIPELFKEWDA